MKSLHEVRLNYMQLNSSLNNRRFYEYFCTVITQLLLNYMILNLHTSKINFWRKWQLPFLWRIAFKFMTCLLNSPCSKACVSQYQQFSIDGSKWKQSTPWNWAKLLNHLTTLFNPIYRHKKWEDDYNFMFYFNVLYHSLEKLKNNSRTFRSRYRAEIRRRLLQSRSLELYNCTLTEVPSSNPSSGVCYIISLSTSSTNPPGKHLNRRSDLKTERQSLFWDNNILNCLIVSR